MHILDTWSPWQLIVPNIYGSSIWNLIHVTLLAPWISRWLLDFWKTCAAPVLRFLEKFWVVWPNPNQFTTYNEYYYKTVHSKQWSLLSKKSRPCISASLTDPLFLEYTIYNFLCWKAQTMEHRAKNVSNSTNRRWWRRTKLKCTLSEPRNLAQGKDQQQVLYTAQCQLAS